MTGVRSVLISAQPLERLLLPEKPLPLGAASRAAPGAPAGRSWFTRGAWRVYAAGDGDRAGGEPIAEFSRDDGGVVAARLEPADGQVSLPFDLGDAYRAYVTEEWADGVAAARRLSPRQLNLFYRAKRLVPRGVQLAARRGLARWQGLPAFPVWPLDLSVAELLRFYMFCSLVAHDAGELRFRWFWPGTHTAAVILTHDVESDEGLRLALAVADAEEELGFRSSFNLGGWYRVDPGLVRELTSRGFEIGMHGLRHDRSLFASREQFEAQLPRLRELAERLGAEGFRSPATHRVVEWLSELPIAYDCSIANSDPFEPQPGGCCTIWPFFLGEVVELPYTLPQDHTLLTLLGHENAQLWIEQAARLEREHGLIQCVSHPDPGYLGEREKLAAYRELLRALAEQPRLWRALPREVAAWWRRRDADPTAAEWGTVARTATPEEIVFEPPTLAATEAMPA